VGLDELHTRIRGKPAWFLVARGKTEGSGHFLGAVLSEDKSQKAWELALDNLGLQQLPASLPLISDGDQAIESAVSQCLPGRRLDRCAWHLLHNVAGWLRERLPGPEQEGQRRGLMAAAQAVVNAASPQLRRSSLKTLEEVAPWLGRALARGLKRVGYSGCHHPRTNNVCERAFREWRRRTRPMDGFKSWRGARNFATLWMLKENARAAGQDWMEVIMP
jgi:transposase-like protein